MIIAVTGVSRLTKYTYIKTNGAHISNRIRGFVKRSPNKVTIGAGDAKQLPPIEDLTKSKKPDEYADECINQIFKYNVMLTIYKRLGQQGDPTADGNRKTLDAMYEDMWLHKISSPEFVHKYFNTTSDNTASTKNIAYTNTRCLTVSNAIRESLGKTEKNEVDEILIWRVCEKTNNVKFTVNYRFRIVNISKNIAKLENVASKQQYVTDLATLDKHFKYDYCTTCHSAQGASIDGKTVIHDWEKSHLVTRERLWCALTRSTDCNNVLFYESAEEEDTSAEASPGIRDEPNETTLNKDWLNKINTYKLRSKSK